ncbi:MAG: hypothetical protein A2W35_12540 [Chloroflexi bacterium RBG_16_57_11]|nr:MAG: hypothetical protein A2W35_12540 [Chloroflexi bacterium RBG_16_57_11]
MRTKTWTAIFSALAALLFAMLACNRPQPDAAPDLDLMVAQTQTAIAVAQLIAPTTAVPATQAPPTTQPTMAISPSATTVSTTQTATQDPNCTDLAKFVNETIPDNTEFAPTAQFMKTWTFQNVGTCTWTPEYKLVFKEGEQMGGTSPAPIGQSVAPNATVQVHLPQTAPAETGEHQGFWMLQNLDSQNFALGSDGSKAFWVKIKVIPGAPTTSGSGLGPPTRTLTFDEKKGTPFYLGEDSDTSFTIENGELIITAFEPAGDLWRVAELGQFNNIVAEANFRTGAECTGKDSYGMILRAPSQPDNVVDSAYVFGFNCDGQFRVYRMDNGSYTGISNWSLHPSLRPGANQKNVMTASADGDRLQLFANGTLVYEFTDSTYSRGLIGLMIGSNSTQNFQVAVEQLAYWELP